MLRKVRLGFVGANVRSKWASASHFPALQACPDVELTAVCTTNPASAEEARKEFGARLAFSDYREMVASPEIDAIVIVVRVPAHHAITMAALAAGKHVYTEWPLGRTTAEAKEMAAFARTKGLQTAAGLQSRVNPGLLHMKGLIDAGYVGQVLACHLSTFRVGALVRPAKDTYKADISQGANLLTIKSAHVIDALRFVVGEFDAVGGMVTTQLKQWTERETGKSVDVTSPDNLILSGRLASGAVASVHVGAIPWAPSGYQMEIYGTAGTLVASSRVSSNHGAPEEMLKLKGTQRMQELQDIEIPEHFTYVPASFPRGTPFNVGQMYALFAQAVREGKAPPTLPTFDTAVELHQLMDSIHESSRMGRELMVSSSETNARIDS